MKLLLATIGLILLASISSHAQTLDGIWEGEIQDPRRPIVINVDFKNQRISFSGGAPTGLSTQSPFINESIVRFEVPNGTQTLKFTGRRNGDRITGEMTGNQTIPFYLEPLPFLPKPAGPAEAWRQDIDVVLTRFLRYDRSYSEPRRAATRARLQVLRAKVGALSNQAIMVELARAVALSGNAHTRLYLMRNRTEVRRVPIRVWWFGPELRIVRASNEHADLVGCRINSVGRSPVITAFQK